MTADEILQVLVESAGDSIFATELAFSGGLRRCDFWTISANGSAGFLAIAYEIKVSRQDFRRDNAIKQREARLYSDQFYYVVPKGMVAKDEVPDWAGLIEVCEGRRKVVVPAPRRDKDAPSWQLVVSIIRNSGKINRDTDQLKKRALIAESQLRDVERALRRQGLEPWRFGIMQ